MNISGQISGLGGVFAVNQGVLNFLSGAVAGGRVLLFVNNPNTGPASAVTVNLFTSMRFSGLNGQIAAAAKGENSAALVLHGASTQLQLFFSAGQPAANFSGVISGTGSVVLESSSNLGPQTFSGNNTYSGATANLAFLMIDGTTSGQGNYTVGGSPSFPAPALGGNGTIGLSPNGTITMGPFAGTLTPGTPSQIGTLSVATSGTGGVIFAAQSTFSVHVGGNGASDLLAISGGSIDLTNASDTLSLSPLSGAFDGSDYTIATFAQNPGGGVFNTVEGLPSGYTVQYNATNIRLVAPALPLQMTAAASRKTHGPAGPFDVNLLATEPVECRASGGEHTLVFTFTNYLVSGGASVSTGTATIAGSPTFSGRTMTVNLTGVADVQKIGVTLHNVTDRFSQVLPNTTVMVNMLVGDTTANRSVNASDVGQTKAASGFAATASNFRQDVTANGAISASDIALVKSRTGAFIAP